MGSHALFMGKYGNSSLPPFLLASYSVQLENRVLLFIITISVEKAGGCFFLPGKLF